jgi:hypothetical protein
LRGAERPDGIATGRKGGPEVQHSVNDARAKSEREGTDEASLHQRHVDISSSLCSLRMDSARVKVNCARYLIP